MTACSVLRLPVAALATLLLLLQLGNVAALAAESAGRWPIPKAMAWERRHGWQVGCNYAPAYAINQLEMWQADTFNLAAIDRELGWAESLGFNSLRVFLHDLAWQQDPKGFLKRVDQFLEVADDHGIRVMLVIFDAVWDPFPAPGPQRAPKPHVHNSGWVQGPGAEILKDPARQDELKPYVQAVLREFRNDKRVLAWDLFNEPENPNRSAYGSVELPNKAEVALELLRRTFAWAREINPSQPLTCGVWLGTWAEPDKLSPMERFQLENSDIITFHNYSRIEDLRACVANLRRYGRPILCTEYMARPAGSTFSPHLGWMKQQGVGAYNWGFAAGKTQTNYPWDSWTRAYTAEPPVWFHEIFHADGRPYRGDEVSYIKSVTGAR